MRRLSWIIRVDPKFSYMYLYKRGRGRSDTQRRRCYKDGAENNLVTGVMQAQPRNAIRNIRR